MVHLFNNFPFLYLLQPLWRDEAFSVLLAQYDPISIVTLTAQDFTPPLYYLLLSLWITVFGTSEIAVRCLLFFFYILLGIVTYYFSKKHLTFAKSAPVISLLLMMSSPMLFYYGFEARAYALVALLSVCSVFAFMSKRWGIYTAVSLALLYTHPYAILLLIIQGLWLLIYRKWDVFKKYVIAGICIGIGYLPWLFVIQEQVGRSKDMWFYPVDKVTLMSSLANLVLGYEGTPDLLWTYTPYISLAILAMFFVGLRKSKWHKTMVFFMLWSILPVLFIIGISFIKPIYVNRYLIFSAPAIIFGISVFIGMYSNRIMRIALVGFFVISSTIFQYWYAPFLKKNDFRTTLRVINSLAQEDDAIVVEDALYYFDVRYYADEAYTVYIYNPDNAIIPVYLGAVLMPKDIQTADKTIGERTFFIKKDTSYTLE